MSITLQILGTLFSVGIMLVILFLLRKGRITVKYSLVWFFSGIVLLILSLFPKLMSSITNLFGFEMSSNFILASLIVLLMIVNVTLTVIISGQTSKIRLLIQEVSMIKGKLDE